MKTFIEEPSSTGNLNKVVTSYSFFVHMLFRKHIQHAYGWVDTIALLSETCILLINYVFKHPVLEFCKKNWVF